MKIINQIKILLILVILICFTVIAYAYVMGGSNLSLSRYNSFDDYLQYSPSKYDLEQYVEAGKTYLENADNDIKRIREAQQEAINKINDAINTYNRGY